MPTYTITVSGPSSADPSERSITGPDRAVEIVWKLTGGTMSWSSTAGGGISIQQESVSPTGAGSRTWLGGTPQYRSADNSYYVSFTNNMFGTYRFPYSASVQGGAGSDERSSPVIQNEGGGPPPPDPPGKRQGYDPDKD